MSKIIKIKKCTDDCPHCTGPDWNKTAKEMQYTCQELPAWIPDGDCIPDWCPLEDAPDTGRDE
ncbi:MAG: hypothetical protein GY846_26385 [Deltaproteobacteria bacterium]|nr:hypothetical protein [Deltaproteobacteria bacterium]